MVRLRDLQLEDVFLTTDRKQLYAVGHKEGSFVWVHKLAARVSGRWKGYLFPMEDFLSGDTAVLLLDRTLLA
jgi:hypothetical protein